MSDEIVFSDGVATKAAEVYITEARPSGWLAWYRFGPSDYFLAAYGNFDNHIRDSYRCPYPLFPTREDAIQAAREGLRERGGEVRVVQVTL